MNNVDKFFEMHKILVYYNDYEMLETFYKMLFVEGDAWFYNYMLDLHDAYKESENEKTKNFFKRKIMAEIDKSKFVEFEKDFVKKYPNKLQDEDDFMNIDVMADFEFG